MKINFVYFDVGGVAIKDFSCTNNWEVMKRSMGIGPEKDTEFRTIWQRYEPVLCLDRPVDSLVPILRQKFNLDLPPNFSFLDQFISRFEANLHLWPVIENIKQKCRIGLLTNMYPDMLNAINQKSLLPEVKWDQIIDSSMEQLRKPELEIYLLAQDRTGVDPEQILFVDNNSENLENPKRLGWQVFHYDSCDYESSNKRLASLFNI